jgi:hypothetical protein
MTDTHFLHWFLTSSSDSYFHTTPTNDRHTHFLHWFLTSSSDSYFHTTPTNDRHTLSPLVLDLQFWFTYSHHTNKWQTHTFSTGSWPPVLIHIFTPHQQMADTHFLHWFLTNYTHNARGSYREITVARALIMKPNCFNADCYLLQKYTVLSVDTYGCCRGTCLPDLQVTRVRLVFGPDHLGSK